MTRTYCIIAQNTTACGQALLAKGGCTVTQRRFDGVARVDGRVLERDCPFFLSKRDHPLLHQLVQFICHANHGEYLRRITAGR